MRPECRASAQSDAARDPAQSTEDVNGLLSPRPAAGWDRLLSPAYLPDTALPPPSNRGTNRLFLPNQESAISRRDLWRDGGPDLPDRTAIAPPWGLARGRLR